MKLVVLEVLCADEMMARLVERYLRDFMLSRRMPGYYSPECFATYIKETSDAPDFQECERSLQQDSGEGTLGNDYY